MVIVKSAFVEYGSDVGGRVVGEGDGDSGSGRRGRMAFSGR